jgi:putative transposase
VEDAGIVPYWRLYYHVVWGTKGREPVIDEAMIAPIMQAIEQTGRESGITVFAVGVMPEHVHVFAQIPPSLVVASVIGRWKERRPTRRTKIGRRVWPNSFGSRATA